MLDRGDWRPYKRDTHSQERPREDGGRSWDAPMSQGARGPPGGGAGAGRADSDPEPSARAGPANTLISEFSRTVKKYMCLVLSHHVDGNLLQQPQEGHTDFTPVDEQSEGMN